MTPRMRRSSTESTGQDSGVSPVAGTSVGMDVPAWVELLLRRSGSFNGVFSLSGSRRRVFKRDHSLFKKRHVLPIGGHAIGTLHPNVESLARLVHLYLTFLRPHTLAHLPFDVVADQERLKENPFFHVLDE